ncbi:hypothetical protein AGMMS50256_37830 [Betaproteobacteria bacterium]|nr:hypothetical protein AGMMS50256_37830 [Betaproteobacteria bacterium]
MYATLPDLVERFGQAEVDQIADITGDAVRDLATVNQAVADADSEINAALAARYTVPVVPTPTLLTRIACDLIRWFLYTTTMPDVVKDRAANARKLLAALSSGEIILPGAIDAPSEAGGGLVEIVSGRDHSPFASPRVGRVGRREG